MLTRGQGVSFPRDVETRFSEEDKTVVGSFLTVLKDKLSSSVEDRIRVHSKFRQHSNLDCWYFQIESPELLRLLGDEYPRGGDGWPTDVAELHVYRHIDKLFYASQRFNFSEGMLDVKNAFESIVGTGFQPYGYKNTNRECSGIITPAELTDTLEAISFERFVKQYYAQMREYCRKPRATVQE